MVNALATSEAARGRKLGRALLEHVEDEAVLRDTDEILLLSLDNAVPFYEHMGYENIIGKAFVKRT
jgi:GNAT superfamily N-acetyltransferase